MKKLKPIIFLLVVMLCLTFVSTMNVAAYDDYYDVDYFWCGDYWCIKLDDGTIGIADYEGDDTNLVVPKTLGGYEVSCCFNGAFFDCDDLVSVTIQDNIDSITYNLFFGCNNLETVYLPDTITEIMDNAFQGCISLKSIVIPDSVTKIGEHVFRNCYNLQSVELSSQLTHIPVAAFYDCTSLSSIHISENISEIGPNAFYNCKFDTISVDEKNTHFDSRNDCNAVINSENNELILGSASTVIPEGVESIGEYAFRCSEIKEVVLPESVTFIDYRAFYCSDLESITFNDTLEGIEALAFLGCNITNIDLPESLTYIGKFAFYQSGLTGEVVIPDGVSEIFDYTFYGCEGITNVVIGNSVTRINVGAFMNCYGLEEVVLPASVKEVFCGAFMNCPSLTDIYVMNPETFFANYNTVIEEGVVIHGHPTSPAKAYADRFNREFVEFKVENVTATSKPISVDLKWDKIDTASKYWIYQFDNEKNDWVCINSTADTEITVRGLVPDTEYKFKVCYNCENRGVSALDNADEVAVVTKNIDVKNVSGEARIVDADITWDPVEDVDKYWIYTSAEEDGEYVCYDSTTDTAYTVNKLQASKDYYYKVISEVKDEEYGDYCVQSSLDNAQALKLTTEDIDVVNLSADAGIIDATITFEPVEGVTRYQIYCAEDDNYKYVGTTEECEYTLENLDPSTKYNVKVISEVQKDDYTYRSKLDDAVAVEVETKSAIAKIAYGGSYIDCISLTWDAIDGVSKYWVYCSENEYGGYHCYMSTTETTCLIENLGFEKEYFFKVVSQVESNGRMYMTNLDDCPTYKISTSDVNVGRITTVPGIVNVELSWAPIQNAKDYWIYYAEWDEQKFTCFTSTTKNKCVVENLKPDTCYRFKIVPQLMYGDVSVFKDIDEVEAVYETTLSLDEFQTELVEVKDGKASITWTPFENQCGYWIMYSTTTSDVNATDEWTVYDETSNTSYTFDSLESDSSYFVTVCASYVNSLGDIQVVTYRPVVVNT